MVDTFPSVAVLDDVRRMAVEIAGAFAQADALRGQLRRMTVHTIARRQTIRRLLRERGAWEVRAERAEKRATELEAAIEDAGERLLSLVSGTRRRVAA